MGGHALKTRLTIVFVHCLLPALALGAEPAADARATEYLCRLAAVPPTVDGDLSDPCWQQAQAPPLFHELGAYGKPMPGLVDLRFLCDDARLYVAADVRSQPGRVPRAKQERLRDHKVFADDSIELYFHTAPGDLDEFCFMVNCDNAILDSCTHRAFRGQEKPGRAFNPEWRHATKKRSGAWSVEMAIPFKALVDKPPQPGWVWRVRVGHNSPAFGNAMWPRNQSTSFHEPTCSGYLIFRDRNLLQNGNFEAAVDSKGRPPGWGFAYYDKEGKGIIQLWDKDAPEGKRCIRYEKFKPYMWFPQLWSALFRYQAHSTYRYSFLINSEKGFVVRHSFYNEEGRRVIKRSTTQPGTKGFERRELLVRAENEAPKLAVGLQLSRTDGVFWVDDVRVERVNGTEFKRRVPALAHRYHRLERVAERRPFKPYDQVVSADQMQPERVIFKDTATGAQIWRLADTPGGSTRHFYMEASPWNCDGSVLMLASREWRQRTNLRYSPDGSTVTRLPYATGWFAWDRRDPKVFYVAGDDEEGKRAIFRYNIDKGERTAIKRYEGSAMVWAVSQDNKYLLIKEAFTDVPWHKRSMIHLLSLDGKQDIPINPKGQIHQLWFTKLPDHSVEFEYEHGGFKPGDYPDGNYMMTKDGKIKLIYGGPGRWAGHRAHSPSGVLMVPGARLQTVNKLTGEIKLLGPGGANHQTWEADESWAAASSGVDVIRFATDGRDFVHRIGSHNSRIGHSTYWTEAHVEMSPDGTKLGYASSMLGDIDFHFVVMMLPGQPTKLTATRHGQQVRLAWRPPKHAKEVAGYVVYRSRRSGVGYELVTPGPVAVCTWTEAPGNGAFYYRVASLEGCGLEGLKSSEACSDPAWPGAVRHVLECEFAPVTKPPAMEAFDTAASGLYAMNLGMDKPATDFTMPFAVPRDGTYALWLRVKSADNTFALRATIDVGKEATLAGKPGTWRWLKVADHLTLECGAHSLALAANVPHVLLDQLVVTDDASPQLAGAEGADLTPPPAPKSLAAKATGRYAVRVEWERVECADFHHLSLYASTSPQCEVTQENLVASPAGESYVHWGLLAGTTYYYRLTAVDRAGNESAGTPVARAHTEPIDHRLFARFDKSWKTRDAEATTVAFDCPSDTNLVLWTKWQCFDSDSRRTKGAFHLKLDGQALGLCGIRFGYICRGHGGPVSGHWLWNFSAPLVERDGRHEFGHRVGKGRHTLEIRRASKADDLECAGIIVTNDFGFLPTGAYWSFLPMAEE